MTSELEHVQTVTRSAAVSQVKRVVRKGNSGLKHLSIRRRQSSRKQLDYYSTQQILSQQLRYMTHESQLVRYT